MHGVYPVLLIAAAAILVGVVVVAMGRGGELALVRSDVPEFRFRLRTPADVAMLRLPIGLLGYREPATNDALRAIAGLLAERDAEIAFLRDRIAHLGGDGQPGSRPVQLAGAAELDVAGLVAAGPGAAELDVANLDDAEPGGVPGGDAVADGQGAPAARPAVPS